MSAVRTKAEKKVFLRLLSITLNVERVSKRDLKSLTRLEIFVMPESLILIKLNILFPFDDVPKIFVDE